ncbi:hypothetical protein Cocul_01171 [Corynebacterium oculi]|uniref:Uncharacterized protein n=1 Tax=Corynebacterium oculi TaxID=1544416 RepID=A0A0N8VZN2_9CORY|nr:hypothetical protein Cocul_01171 [Corynebacterium oculi]
MYFWSDLFPYARSSTESLIAVCFTEDLFFYCCGDGKGADGLEE